MGTAYLSCVYVYQHCLPQPVAFEQVCQQVVRMLSIFTETANTGSLMQLICEVLFRYRLACRPLGSRSIRYPVISVVACVSDKQSAGVQ